MKRNNKGHIILLLLLFTTIFSVFSQEGKIKRADVKYENLSYMDAVYVYEKVVEKGYGTPDIYEKLGNAYYYNGAYEKASQWYERLFDSRDYDNSEVMYRYAQALKSMGNYGESDKVMDKFSQLRPEDVRSLRYKGNGDYLEKIEAVSNRGDLNLTSVNTELSDYGGSFYDSLFIFTSNRKIIGPTKDIHTWTDEPFSNIYQARVGSDYQLSDVRVLKGKKDVRYNESSAIITKDGSTLYFTRNDPDIKRKNATGVILKIYRATYRDGKWSDVEALPFTSDQYNCAHPVLSSDEKALYFASDMPGGYGSSDIYVAPINADGSIGKAENLGPHINTQARETFPYVSDTGLLYFASDGHLGLGGLDVFAIKIEDFARGEIVNVGRPINTKYDDFAYIQRDSNAFLSSNREGNDQIYMFKELVPLPIACNNVIEGTVSNAKNQKPIVDAKVTLLDAGMEQLKEVSTNGEGYYSFKGLDCSKQYYVRVEANTFATQEKTTTTPARSDVTRLDFVMAPLFDDHVDLAKLYDIENIYFDFDKWDITPRAEEKLNILLGVLRDHPSIHIDIRSHTDSRGSDAYNIVLSDNRAKSTLGWLVAHGIARERLSAQGYGETQLVNGCSNGVPCTKQEHQDNRRSEFIIVN